MSDLGFAEAYMFQEINCEDLISVFLVCKPNFLLALIRLISMDADLCPQPEAAVNF